MTDIEYDIIDELYFVISFEDLLRNVSIEEKVLVYQLKEMINKEWVRCFINISGDEPSKELDFENQYKNYYYLASKEGLKAHNTL